MKKQIETELIKMVQNAKKIPSLTEIRIFGSYNNGNWDSETSDVDIFAGMGDTSSSFRSCRANGRDNKNYRRVDGIKNKIRKGLSKKIAGRMQIDVLNPDDLNELWNHEFIPGKGPYGQNVKQGRLIYSVNRYVVEGYFFTESVEVKGKLTYEFETPKQAIRIARWKDGLNLDAEVSMRRIKSNEEGISS